MNSADFGSAIDRWVEQEFCPWRGGIDDGVDLADALIASMARDYAIVVLHIEDGDVTIDPACRLFDDPENIHLRALAVRGYFYRDFFQTVVTEHKIRGSAVVGIFVDDRNPRSDALPYLCFQKDGDTETILVPDVDFMANVFYADDGDRFTDDLPFEAKKNEAIFVGSTTGTPCLTINDVVTGSNERLHAAVFFKDRADVTFSLPNIVQFDEPATYEAIIALGFERRHASWREQLSYRYLISMDGNGATCSRMVIGLASNSAVLKYRSPSQLFYFHGLEAGVHYIPIERDQDVVDILARSQQDGAAHQAIAAAGRDFAEAYLSRRGIMAYTAGVLSRYIDLFGTRPQPTAADARHPMDSFGHVQGIGTIWTSLGDWSGVAGRPLEGFAVMPNEKVSSTSYEYAAVTHRYGERTSFVRGGRYCGSQGQSAPIHGICIRSTDAGARTAAFVYRCKFLDGHISEWHEGGSWIERTAPLVGFQVSTLLYPY